MGVTTRPSVPFTFATLPSASAYPSREAAHPNSVYITALCIPSDTNPAHTHNSHRAWRLACMQNDDTEDAFNKEEKEISIREVEQEGQN
jgi:hypothetical protein